MRVKEVATVNMAGREMFVSLLESAPPAEAGNLVEVPSSSAAPPVFRCTLAVDKRLGAAKALRDSGNRLVDKKLASKAVAKYTAAERYITAEPSLLSPAASRAPAEVTAQARRDLATIYCNMGRAQLKSGDTETALHAVDRSVEVSGGTHCKAYFLRAQLLRALKRFAEARADLATLSDKFSGEADQVAVTKELAGISEDEEAMSSD